MCVWWVNVFRKCFSQSRHSNDILENQEMYDVVLYIGLLKCKHLFRDIAELDLYNGLPEHYTHCENNSES